MLIVPARYPRLLRSVVHMIGYYSRPQHTLLQDPARRLRCLVAQPGKLFAQSYKPPVIGNQFPIFHRLSPFQHIDSRVRTVTVIISPFGAAKLLPRLEKKISLACKIYQRRQLIGGKYILIGDGKVCPRPMKGHHQFIPQREIVMSGHIIDDLGTAFGAKLSLAAGFPAPAGHCLQNLLLQALPAVYKSRDFLIKHMALDHIPGVIAKDRNSLVQIPDILLQGGTGFFLHRGFRRSPGLPI